MNYLQLVAKVLDLPRPVERSPYELEGLESFMARERGRKMDSTSKESPEDQEAPTTKS